MLDLDQIADLEGDVRMWFKTYLPERRREEWQTLMSKMSPDPQGTYGQTGDSTGSLGTWEEQVAWLLRLLDMHHGEAVLMPLDAYDTPWEWKGLSDLRDLRLVRHRTWPDDVADYLSQAWPF